MNGGVGIGRVLAIWLDGFDVGLADTGGLEALCGFVSQPAHAVLDTGLSFRTGLAGDHLSTGCDPAASGRASAVHFDPATYSCEQRGAIFQPVLGDLPSVVLDPRHFDLAAARPKRNRGFVPWRGPVTPVAVVPVEADR